MPHLETHVRVDRPNAAQLSLKGASNDVQNTSAQGGPMQLN